MNKQNVFTGLDHPALAVDDVDGMAAWCCETLGYEKMFRLDSKPVWIVRAPDGTLIEIMPRDDTPRPNRTTWTPGWSHLAVRVSNLEEAIRHLDALKITWAGEIAPAIGGGRVRSFLDPEGNLWQIVERPA